MKSKILLTCLMVITFVLADDTSILWKDSDSWNSNNCNAQFSTFCDDLAISFLWALKRTTPINNCISNINGQLKKATSTHGNFLASCKACVISFFGVPKTAYLDCKCLNMNLTYVSTRLDLQESVGLSNCP